MEDDVPIASAAAWSPTAAPQPRHQSKILTLEDGLFGQPRPAVPEPEPEPEPAPPPTEPVPETTPGE